MKTTKLILIIFALFAGGWLLQGCKDNILTPVTNNKPADSLTALINKVSAQLLAVNAKDNTLKIQLAKFGKVADSLTAVSSSNVQTVQYTVYIMDGSNTTVIKNNGQNPSGGRVAGVDGATVTVLSSGQAVSAASVDGRAVFNNLSVAGLVTVNIIKAGFASVSYTTYFGSQSGMALNASTNILMFPTSGSEVSTYTGQLFINKSVLDDTLGRQYIQSGAKLNTFISNYGPYGGSGNTNFGAYGYNTNYATNEYGYPSGQNIKWDSIKTWSNANVMFGFPTNVVDYNYNNTYLPGDPMEVTITGIVSIADIDATGKYTLKIASYMGNPGASIGFTTIDWNDLNVDDFTYTYGVSSSTLGAKKVTINIFDKNLTTTPTDYYTLTKKWTYAPVIQNDNSGYEFYSTSTNFSGLPGQTLVRNVFFFPYYPVQ